MSDQCVIEGCEQNAQHLCYGEKGDTGWVEYLVRRRDFDRPVMGFGLALCGEHDGKASYLRDIYERTPIWSDRPVTPEQEGKLNDEAQEVLDFLNSVDPEATIDHSTY